MYLVYLDMKKESVKEDLSHLIKISSPKLRNAPLNNQPAKFEINLRSLSLKKCPDNLNYSFSFIDNLTPAADQLEPRCV